MVLYVKQDENTDWQKAEPLAYNSLMQGYKECMPGVKDDLLHWRYLQNEHLANPGFGNDPQYFMAIGKMTEGSGIAAISALYVFPEYRRQGFAKLLLEQVKALAAANDIVLQVAVASDKYANLEGFYKKAGFKTTGHINKPDGLGLRYIDLFWYAYPIALEYDENNGTKINKLRLF